VKIWVLEVKDKFSYWRAAVNLEGMVLAFRKNKDATRVRIEHSKSVRSGPASTVLSRCKTRYRVVSYEVSNAKQ